jgi:hypothetical protein
MAAPCCADGWTRGLKVAYSSTIGTTMPEGICPYFHLDEWVNKIKAGDCEARRALVVLVLLFVLWLLL